MIGAPKGTLLQTIHCIAVTKLMIGTLLKVEEASRESDDDKQRKRRRCGQIPPDGSRSQPSP
jgi:hypothetical protein